jgi:hypothetical protein
MAGEFQATGANAAALFTLKLHRDEGMLLLAMLEEGQAAEELCRVRDRIHGTGWRQVLLSEKSPGVLLFVHGRRVRLWHEALAAAGLVHAGGANGDALFGFEDTL